MTPELRCGCEGTGVLSDEIPARFCFAVGTATFYFNDARYDPNAVPGTVLTGTRKNSVYEFQRVPNGEYPKWRITSIKKEMGAKDLFGKSFSVDEDDTYYIPTSYNGLMFNVYKSNVERKILKFLSDLKDIETEDELRELVWEFKYGSSVSEWIANPVEYLNREFAINDNKENAIDEAPQLNEIGLIIDIDEKQFSLKTEEGQLYLFVRTKKESDDKIDETGVWTVNQIEGKRGLWFYTFTRIGDTDKWRIVSKILQK